MLKQMISIVAVAGLVLALALPVQGANIDVSDQLVDDLGLVEGDTFRMVFATSTTTRSAKTVTMSTDIDFYNTFVTNAANNLDGNTGSIVAAYGWDWSVIGSTADDDAIDNTSTTGTGFPIYLVGTHEKVADTYTDLWDGSIDTAININEDGDASTPPQGRVWTGTLTNGTVSGDGLGALGLYGNRWGSIAATNATWIQNGGEGAVTKLYGVYAMSEPLHVTSVPVPGPVPEPATMCALGLAVAGLGGYVRKRRKA